MYRCCAPISSLEEATVAKRVSVPCVQSHARPVCACVRVCMCCTYGRAAGERLCIRSHAQRVLVRVRVRARVRVLVPVRRKYDVYVKAM